MKEDKLKDKISERLEVAELMKERDELMDTNLVLAGRLRDTHHHLQLAFKVCRGPAVANRRKIIMGHIKRALVSLQGGGK